MAKIEGCIDNIVGGEQPLLILDKSHSFLTELQFLHKLYGFIHVPVVGHIVDKNNMVVFIFLLQYGENCFFVPVLAYVVMAEHCYTKWHLFLFCAILIDLVKNRVLDELELVEGVIGGEVNQLLPVQSQVHFFNRNVFILHVHKFSQVH